MTNRKERRAARKTRPSISPPHGPGGTPSIAAAFLSKGKELLASGDDEAALDLACRIILIEETPETKAFFIRCVKGWSYFPGAEEMQGTLARALREAWTWPAQILGPVLGILQKDKLIGTALDRAVKAWPRRLAVHELLGAGGLATIAGHPLLLALLETTQIPDRGFERLLTTLRCAILEAATAGRGIVGDDVVRLASAMAKQCLINEYLFDVTDEETTRVNQLREAICSAFETKKTVQPIWLAAVAAYIRLDSLPVKPLWEKSWPNIVSDLLNLQVHEPAALQRHRAAIPHLTPITDAVSLTVKNQYEENPYPRWIRSPAATSPISIDAFLRREFPHHAFGAAPAKSQLDVLVAGCGTGRQSIDFAQLYEGAKVLAVDLGLSSLAYAKAKTSAAGVNNVEYAQADILELGRLGRTFDVIASSGVLHHLAEPMAGWRVLSSLLRPEGVMYIGLYSESARRGIVAARAWIAAQGYESTPDDIRRCRQELSRIDDMAWKSVFTMIDFYSVSECRDLLFHVQEHRFTLPQIATFLDDNELKFLGFNIGDKILRKFRRQFPADKDLSDLRLWHAFETENPDTFINMYQFWVQKSGQA